MHLHPREYLFPYKSCLNFNFWCSINQPREINSSCISFVIRCIKGEVIWQKFIISNVKPSILYCCMIFIFNKMIIIIFKKFWLFILIFKLLKTCSLFIIILITFKIFILILIFFIVLTLIC